MGFISRKGIFYKSLFYVICFLWLCGSDRVASSFKIYRSVHDIFENLKCSSDNCTEFQCEMYGGGCYSSSNCNYCRCSAEGKNTFMVSNYTGMDDQIHGGCKRDEEIVPESVPNAAFSLKNIENEKCLQSVFKYESNSRRYIIGTNCTSSPNPDMLWMWTTTEDKRLRLVNVKTLQCMRRGGNDADKVIIRQCKIKAGWQNIQCTQNQTGMRIEWRVWEMMERKPSRYLHLQQIDIYAISTSTGDQLWSNNETSCDESTAYNGCYRFSDGSFMRYLNFSTKNPELSISAPFFEENNGTCSVCYKFKFIRDGEGWKDGSGSLFYINHDLKKLEIRSIEDLKPWNGSLLKLNVSCPNETYCVLLKLKSVPPYSEVHHTSSSTDVPHLHTTPTITTENEKTTSKRSNQPTTPTMASTTENPQEGPREEASGSGGINATAFAITVTLLLVALALALGFLFYYRRRKRAQVPENKNVDLGVVNYSRDIYEDPDRIYETLKEDGYEVPPNEQGTNSDSYSYPKSRSISNPPSSEQEYIYAKDTNSPRSSVGTREASDKPISNGQVYQTSKQPGQLSDDHFYNYPENTNITKSPPSELEYTYAKDTDIPRATADREAKPEEPASNAVYHTLEQEQPPNTDLYELPGANILTELEYAYAKDTDISRIATDTKSAAKGDRAPTASTALEKPVPTEEDYTRAKNTEIPSIFTDTEQMRNGDYAASEDSSLYHTLEEPSPPQPPVYLTLEEPEDADNHK